MDEDRRRTPAESAGGDRGPGEEVVSARPGDGALPRDEANKDVVTRQWDPVTPSATLIGRAEGPESDVEDTLRRLHDEHHPAMAGHSERMHRLDKARITQAVCNALDLTAWERDRVLGVMVELDLTAFGSQRAIPKVALVVIQHVVDDERRRRLGLHDREFVGEMDQDRMSALYDRFQSLTDDERYRELLSEHGLDVTSVNRLDRVLQEQLETQGLSGVALGRIPNRDPNLPELAANY